MSNEFKKNIIIVLSFILCCTAIISFKVYCQNPIVQHFDSRKSTWNQTHVKKEKVTKQDTKVKSETTKTVTESNENNFVTQNNNPHQDNNTEIWQKIKENFYIDKTSIEIQDDFINGIFKKDMSSKNEYKNGVKITYKTIWTGAYCDIELQGGLKKMEYPIYKYYDINKNLIYEDNIHEYWTKEYPGGHLGITYPEDVEDGKLLFNFLCQYYKK